MLLRKGETTLKQQEKVTVSMVRAEGGAKQGSTTGTFYLTSQRIVFESVSGMFSKKTTTVLDCTLDRVANVTIEGMFGKKLVLQMPMKISEDVRMSGAAGQVGEVEVKATFDVSEPVEWERAIRSALAG